MALNLNRVFTTWHTQLSKAIDSIRFELDCLCCTFDLCPTSGKPLILLSLHQVSLVVHLCPLVTHLSFLFSPLQTRQKTQNFKISRLLTTILERSIQIKVLSTHNTALNIDDCYLESLTQYNKFIAASASIHVDYHTCTVNINVNYATFEKCTQITTRTSIKQT